MFEEVTIIGFLAMRTLVLSSSSVTLFLQSEFRVYKWAVYYHTRDGNRSGRPAPVGCRSGRVTGWVGSTLGDRCVTGRPHKMQKETFSSTTNLKLNSFITKFAILIFFYLIEMW